MNYQLGLIGYPLGHSLSPDIHQAALTWCGLQGDYSLFPITSDDLEGLNALLAGIRKGKISGLNVTIPHKQNVIPLLDELTSTATAIGAVNTIYLRENNLIGDNTDAPGFLADLKLFLENQKSKIENRKSALILGAGGSARAVVYALVHEGWKVTVAARRPEQAQELIAQFPGYDSKLSLVEYPSTSLHSLLPAFTLIVNTTPVGMSPTLNTSPWPIGQPFPPDAVIYDLVYNPRETRLVKDARAAGSPATTGLGMLIEQAALSFEIWTGCSVPRGPLFAAVEAL